MPKLSQEELYEELQQAALRYVEVSDDPMDPLTETGRAYLKAAFKAGARWATTRMRPGTALPPDPETP